MKTFHYFERWFDKDQDEKAVRRYVKICRLWSEGMVVSAEPISQHIGRTCIDAMGL
jgi:hypothetical protein